MLQAKALGYKALAITDRNSLAGIARARAMAAEVASTTPATGASASPTVT